MRPVALHPSAGPASPPHAGPAGVRPGGTAGTRPANRSDAPRPTPAERITAMAAGFVTLFLEIEAGCRPRTHLAPLMTPMLYARLSEVWVRGGTPGSVLLARVTGRTQAGWDVVVIVRRGGRCGAVGLQLIEGRRGWVVADVALPERGPLPLPPYPVPADKPDPDDELSLVPLPLRSSAPVSPPVDWFHTPAPG